MIKHSVQVPTLAFSLLTTCIVGALTFLPGCSEQPTVEQAVEQKKPSADNEPLADVTPAPTPSQQTLSKSNPQDASKTKKPTLVPPPVEVLPITQPKTSAPPQTTSPQKPEKMLTEDDLKYIGAFRLPDTDAKLASRFPYGGTPIAFNPAGNSGKGSLYIGGHDHHQLVAEVTVPEVINSRNLKNLKTAELLQPFADVTGGLRGYHQDKQMKLGGMLVHNGKLLWTVYLWYNVTATNLSSHGVSDFSLTKPNAKGLWYIGDYHIQKTSGFMCSIPEPWQKDFGFPLLTGQQRGQGRATSSEGPSAFGFDVGDMEALPKLETKLKARELLWYDAEHPAEYTLDNSSHKWKGANSIAGMVFPVSGDGQKSALVYFCKVGLHPTDWYGEAKDFPGPGIPDNDSRGYHAPPYKLSAWFYHPTDLLKTGTAGNKPWTIKPRIQIDLNSHLFTKSPRLGAVGYDPKTRRIFLTELYADQKNQYESWPVVHVFSVP